MKLALQIFGSTLTGAVTGGFLFQAFTGPMSLGNRIGLGLAATVIGSLVGVIIWKPDLLQRIGKKR